MENWNVQLSCWCSYKYIIFWHVDITRRIPPVRRKLNSFFREFDHWFPKFVKLGSNPESIRGVCRRNTETIITLFTVTRTRNSVFSASSNCNVMGGPEKWEKLLLSSER